LAVPSDPAEEVSTVATATGDDDVWYSSIDGSPVGLLAAEKLLNLIGTGLFRFDFDTSHFMWTRKLADALGIEGSTAGAPQPQLWLKKVAVEDVARLRKELAAVTERQQTVWKTSIRVNSDDEPATYALNGLVSYKDGRPTGILATVCLAENGELSFVRKQLGDVCHDIRNPLGTMSSALEVLKRSEPASPVAKSAKEILGRQIDQLTVLVDRLNQLR
jgi:signal transduction histidine kinase